MESQITVQQLVVPNRKGKHFNNWEGAVNQLKGITNSIGESATTSPYVAYQILAISIAIFSLVIALLVEEQFGQLWTVRVFNLGVLASIVVGLLA